MTLSTNRRHAAGKLIDLIGAEEIPDGPLTQGAKLGRYVVLEHVGSGGLGDVYKAYDPKLDRRVAVKLLRPEAPADEVTRRRLEREARALAKLDHPNVVTVFDYGIEADRLYVAMEFIEGRSLRQWLADTPRDWAEIRDVFVEAGRGLEAAHKAKLVHRDFKPDNVLVDRSGRVRVVDFGLARGSERPSSGPDVPEGDGLTDAGVVIGTPLFMPPEQLRGLALDGRADQFAFCVALYQALFDAWPFFGNDLPTRLRSIVSTDPTPASNPRQAPGWLRRAVLRGLRPDPQQRFDSMGRLLDEMQRDRRGRRRQLWTVAASGLTGALVAAGLMLRAPTPTSQDEAWIEQAEARARDAAQRGYFVYPDRDPAPPSSALTELLELEASEFPEARQRAAALRLEFAHQLVELADAIATEPGGEGYAADYYAAALIFDPEHADARRRTRLTPGEVALLRDKAVNNEFSEFELDAGEALAEIAGGGMLDQPDAPPAVAAEPPPQPVAAEPPAPPEPDVAPAGDRPQPDVDTKSQGPRTAPDLERYRQELAAAKTAARATRFDQAKQHYHRALAAKPGGVEALAGLATAHFETYDYSDAKKYAGQAVRRAPRRAGLHILLGDALYKLTDYRAAHDAYLRADELGSSVAAGRLAKTRGKVGAAAP